MHEYIDHIAAAIVCIFGLLIALLLPIRDWFEVERHNKLNRGVMGAVICFYAHIVLILLQVLKDIPFENEDSAEYYIRSILFCLTGYLLGLVARQLQLFGDLD